jgi:hypothetical protein
MGFRPFQTYVLVASAVPSGPLLPIIGPENICIRLIIGHEQVADNATLAFVRQAISADESDVDLFRKALSTVTPGLNQNPHASLSILKGIRVGTGQGNSMQDLQLSLFGFKFGQMIRGETINTRAFAARWIRSNIGGVDKGVRN